MKVDQNFSIVAGDSLTVRLRVLKVDGTAYDLTGCSVKWVARPRWAGGPNLITKTVGTGIVVTDAVGGIVTITLGNVDTKDLVAERYFHGAIITSGADTYSVMVGTMQVLPTVA